MGRAVVSLTGLKVEGSFSVDSNHVGASVVVEVVVGDVVVLGAGVVGAAVPLCVK